MRLLFAALLLVATMPISTTAAETKYEESGNFWMEACATGSTYRLHCMFHINGILKGAIGQAALSNTKLVICPPSEMTSGQAADVVHAFLVKNPEVRHQDISILVFSAMAGAFMCKK